LSKILLGVALMLTLGATPAQAMVEYQLAVAFNLDQQTVQGVASLTIPSGQGLHLDLNGLTIAALDLNGQPLAAPRNGILAVPANGNEQHLSVHYQKSFQGSHDNLVSPDGIALTSSWHPLPDIDCRYHLQVSLPKGFEAVSEADRIDTETTAGGKTERFTIDQALPGITLVAGPYVVAKDTFGNNQTLYSYFFAEDADLAASYRQKALAYLKRYEELIGPYPYQRFSIVENRLPTGFAMAAYTLLGQSIVRLPFITDTSLGHEILHSWFGNAIRVDQSQGNWCEGLVTYMADQAFAADRGEGAAFRRDELLKYQHYVRPDTAIAVKDFHGAEPGGDIAQQAIRAVGYGKTAMIFRMLDLKIGHDRFIAGLRHLYKTMNRKVAGWDSLEASFEQGGESLKPFFDQWLNRRDLPRVTAEDIDLAEKDGVLTLSFTLHQATDTPYTLAVPVVVVAGNNITRIQVPTTSADRKVVLSLKEYPSALVIDPDYDLMRVLATIEVPPSWDWFNGSAKRLAVVGSPADYDLYRPLIEQLKAQGVAVASSDKVTYDDLASQAIIFLGTSGALSRSLFANPSYPATGMTIDIRKNPLNSQYPAVLVSASSRAEVEAGFPKLRHYGTYGYLHFDNGRAMEKRVLKASLGMSYSLDDAPNGIEVARATRNFSAIMGQLVAKQVIYVGETHTRYEDHKLQLRVIRELFNQGKEFAIGMEMFPHAAQPALDAFINGDLDEARFLKQSRYFEVWGYDYRLYREILNFARHNKIPVIGLNLDKSIVNKVFKEGGLDSLTPEERAALPPDRNLDAPGYQDRIQEVFSSHPNGNHKQFDSFLEAQAIWDEVMARTITDYLDRHPGHKMVVLAGNGHMVKENAIPPRVARRRQVDQAVVMSSDGTVIDPTEADYLVFMPPTPLAPPAQLGIVMGHAKEQGPIAIDEVVDQSPAFKAGIHKGDLLLAMDGQPVKSPGDVKIIMLTKKSGDTVKVTVRRSQPKKADQELSFDITL
jgi:aminopeptidase N